MKWKGLCGAGASLLTALPWNSKPVPPSGLAGTRRPRQRCQGSWAGLKSVFTPGTAETPPQTPQG